MDLGLKDKMVLVSGGAKGIGEATVRLLVAEGAKVVFVDRDLVAGPALARELGVTDKNAYFVAGDLSLESDCRKAVDEVVNLFGGIDILINNAGVNDGVGLEHLPENFMRSLQDNLFHVFALAHYSLPYLKKSNGAIVNVSSKVSVTGQGRTSGYAAAKGAINALTREWALALAPFNVRVNTVVPAECLTDQYERWFRSLPNPDETRAAIEKMIPLGRRMTSKEEVAAMIVFLASERSSHTTGQLVFVDGGYTHLDRAMMLNFQP